MNKKQACELLHISNSTLDRRMKDGTYKYTKQAGQFGEVSFTRADLGLSEVQKYEIPLPYQDPAPVRVAYKPPQLEAIEKKELEDLHFASRYIAGAATDSFGNTIDGNNAGCPTKGTASLVKRGPIDPVTPSETQSHMKPELLSNYNVELPHKDWHGGEPAEPQGFTNAGVALCPGISQEDYDGMMVQFLKRNPKGRSEAEYETKQRRDVRTILQSFPKG
jgi:hypothetical protein